MRRAAAALKANLSSIWTNLNLRYRTECRLQLCFHANSTGLIPSDNGSQADQEDEVMASHRGNQLERRLLTLLAVTTLVPLGALAYLSYPNSSETLIFGSVSRYSLVFTSAGGLALLASCIVATRMLRHKFKLISDLEEVVHMLARGDYSRRIDLASSGEFTSLGRAFNEMTEQLEHSLKSSQSVADIDRLILSSADLETVLRKVLLSARSIRGEIMLILRPDIDSNALTTYRLDKHRLVEGSVGLLEVSDDSLRDIDGYEQVAARICGENVWVCLAIETAGVISGALVATGESAPKTVEVQQLGELSDRLSVAITNIQRSDSLYQKAHFDDLTGLINRHAFEDRLREQISRSWRGEKGAVMFIDLDDFKKVNDTEGHKAGDRLLIEISKRLATALREVDTIARLGGDEFAVIVPGCDDEKSVSDLCERIIQSLTKPIIVDRIEHTVGASIGVALFPDDGQVVEELVMKADSAMYRAKETGRARFAFFDDSLNEANRYRVLVESRLRGALKRNELELHFQPKLDLETRAVESAEALMRWTDDELGVVEPDTFVPIAEETNLIHEFTAVQVDQTANLLAAADAAGIKLEHVAINASAKQLMTEGFSLSLLSMLDQRALPHRHIEIEVTESVFARDTQLVVRELEILQSAGIRIALDDFGTGYSSLNMLRELPLDVVKIDRSFITELETSDQARILVQHLISIAATLGKQVVAEGVETEVQLQHLIDADCHYAQGFLISKAKPLDEFIKLLADWQSDESSHHLKLVT